MLAKSRVCCDANLVVRYVTNPSALAVAKLWRGWIADSKEVVAPPLFRYEVTNAIHRFGTQSKLTPVSTSLLLDNALGLGVQFVDYPDIHKRALTLARELNMPAAYDAHYLALAESEGVALFTADRKLFNAARHRFPGMTLVE